MSDEEIQKNVLEQLKWDSRVKPTEIGVTVKDGVVTLVGTVDSYVKKWSADDVALRVAGVKGVANELQVKLPSSSERTDDEIARAATSILELSADVPDTIKVLVESGWVSLQGEVEYQHQKEAAERKVRDLVGVKGVVNQLVVKPKAKPEDVKHRIEEALVRSAETDASNIEVEVLDGRVVLKGRVHSWFEKEEARREAWMAPGVREVDDRLVIEP